MRIYPCMYKMCVRILKHIDKPNTRGRIWHFSSKTPLQMASHLSISTNDRQLVAELDYTIFPRQFV